MEVSRGNKQLPPIRVGGKSPLLERRAQNNVTGLGRLPAGDEGSAPGGPPRSPRGLHTDDYEDFRNLAIGSPIPTLGADHDPTSPGRGAGNDQTGFPFITIQKCEEGATGAGSCHSEGSGKSRGRSRPHSPAVHIDVNTVPLDTSPGSPRSPRSGATTPRSTPSPLLAPATPPVQPRSGEKQYVVYGKDGEQTVRSYSRENLRDPGISPGSHRKPTGSPRQPRHLADSESHNLATSDVKQTAPRKNPVRLEPLGKR